MNNSRWLSAGYLFTVLGCLVALPFTVGAANTVLVLSVLVLTFPTSILSYALAYILMLASGWMFYADRAFWLIAFPLFMLAAIVQVLLARCAVRLRQKHRTSARA